MYSLFFLHQKTIFEELLPKDGFYLTKETTIINQILNVTCIYF